VTGMRRRRNLVSGCIVLTVAGQHMHGSVEEGSQVERRTLQKRFPVRMANELSGRFKTEAKGCGFALQRQFFPFGALGFVL
jgi:hypothetical protein